MNWKHFLKPNKKKVIIAIVIVLILFIIEALTYTWFSGNFGCFDQCGDYFLPWEVGSCGHCGYPDLLNSILIEIYWPLVILMTLIISFLSSCLMVWIYDKSKKVKKK